MAAKKKKNSKKKKGTNKGGKRGMPKGSVCVSPSNAVVLAKVKRLLGRV